ncbi:MAG: APC family permease [Alphaproteobacteria bacterium]|nr:APC family permease [Alphaproteobacteria bacterium]
MALGRIPWLSHGNVVSAALGWSAWVGYSTAAPIETLAMLRYLGPQIPFIYAAGPPLGQDAIQLSLGGYAMAFLILVVMIVINLFGVRFFAAVNTGLTWFKVGAPLVVALALAFNRFEFGNFMAHEFAPFGLRGILAGVASGGVVFAFIGFRHAIDMAGETRNPQRTIPVALIGSVIICLGVYLVVQAAFVGSLSPAALANGWDNIKFPTHYGAFEAIAMAVGVPWLMAAIYGSAVLAPFGGGLVATGSNARLAKALAENGFFPKLVANLSSRGVPVNGLLINLAAGVILLIFVHLESLVSLNSSAIVLSFTIGPVALYALRLQAPNMPRHFRLPRARGVACAAFILATLILYWSGWNTLWFLGMALAFGLILFTIMRLLADPATRPQLDLRESMWLWPYILVMGLISYLGAFGGGLGIIEWGMGVWVLIVVGFVFFFWAVKSRLPDDAARSNIRTALTAPDLEIDEDQKQWLNQDLNQT